MLTSKLNKGFVSMCHPELRQAASAKSASVSRRGLALVLAAGAVMLAGRVSIAQVPLSVRITSPRGRTGTSATVRIVARVQAPPDTTLGPVRFFIDDQPYKVDDDGPPYAVEWVDENPFQKHDISVEVEDAAGHTARDSVVLDPYEVTDAVDVFSVMLDTSVRDLQGRFIGGIDPSHFQVLEDNVAQAPQFVRNEAVPTTFVLLVDTSGSMKAKFSFVRQAAARLISYLRPADRVIVAPFSNTLEPLTGPTDDPETILGAIDAMQAQGGTAIFDALKQVAPGGAPEQGRRVLVLITDGYDENSTASFDDAMEAVKRAQATVYVVEIGGTAGISSGAESQFLQLANESGGRLFVPPRIEAVAAAYEQIAIDAKSRYLLSYTPINQAHDGTWRQVSVSAGSPEYVVSTRAGYYAPAPSPIKPNIEFTVSDPPAPDEAPGAPVHFADVSQDDLVVLEDGVEQKVENFEIVTDPIQIVMALDESGSMRKAVDGVKGAAREFVGSLEPDDPLALVTFSDNVVLAQDLSTDRKEIVDGIDQYQALGGTALYDALYESLTRLNEVQGRRAIVILTDGRDENNPGTAPGSIHSLDEVMDKAKEVDTAVYAIGLGPKVDRPLLAKLAEISGGAAYFPDDVSALAAQYRGIVENLRRRYTLQYTSTNTKHDGAWRTVQIRARDKDLQFTSRGGYFAPDK